ncbi:MAG: CoA transferase [Clostridia bacterium]|jgi:crotonobetainyl-CoA:carnitine CoA-transferase CaiB-like acyl-CoA transferase|nr:CoA transferase [Clostridia bacterium]MCI1999325.1 CoA transferase [Clostridia bacterium]MCI2015173.1 CoA transferase [Clostridia bacterium]
MGQLDGVKIVELATFIAAPSCARILASYGADVIKVEAPRGDDLRVAGRGYFYPAPDENGDTAVDVQNFNKRDLAINLKDPKGMEAFLKLLAKADVFITNNRVKSLVKMGLDYDTLHKKFPRLIHASILGYGEAGPLKDKPGFDYTAYFARGGIANSLMEKGTSPCNAASGFGDNYAGITLSSGICAALYRQAKTGLGERVTVGLYDTAIYGLNWLIGATEYGSKMPMSRRHTNSAVCTTYKTKDGRWIQLAVIQYDKSIAKLAKSLEVEDQIMKDDRFNTYPEMLKHIEELVDVLEPAFAKKTLAEWVDILTAADIPFEIVQTMEEITKDPQAWENDYIFKKPQKDGKNIYYIRTPVVFTEAPAVKEESGRGRGPKLGEDSTEILKSIGYDDATINEFKKNGVVIEDK